MNYSVVQPNEKLSDQESVTTQRAGDNNTTTTTTTNDKSSHQQQQKQPIIANDVAATSATTTTSSHAATTKITTAASAAAAVAVSSSINASASNTTSTISSSPTTSNNPNNATAPFPVRLHQLLEDSTKYGFDDIIGWQPGGTSFKVYKVEKFASEIMTNYFIRQTKYKSFQRQISTYGFRRIEKGPLKNGYMHPNFTRDKPPDLEILSRKIRGPSPRQQQQQQQQQLNPSSPPMSNKSTSPSPTKVGVGDSKTITTTATSNKGDQDVAASGTAGVMMMASLSSAEQQHKEGATGVLEKSFNDSMSTIDDFGLDHQDFRNLHLSLSPSSTSTKATKLKDDPMTTTGSKGNDEDDELSPILDPFADEDNNNNIPISSNNNDNDDDVPILPQQQQHDIQSSMGTASATTTTATIQETAIVAGATNTMLMIDRSESRFPWKLYDMLEDAKTENFTHIVSWVERGNAFKVHNESEFVSKVMPQYFDQTKFESFKRQLNMYGFSSVRKGNKGDKERSGIVNHPCFLRGHKDLCSEITRRQENDIWHVI